MHALSMEIMHAFKEVYLAAHREVPLDILDVGSQVVRPGDLSYRSLFETTAWRYRGLDESAGPNVDVAVARSYRWDELGADSVDLVVSGQAFEHIPYFWVTAFEIGRVLRPGGLCVLIVPSKGPEHRFPVDCWRFYRDGVEAICAFLGFRLLDSFTDWNRDYFGDSTLVMQKPLWTVAERAVFLRRRELQQAALSGEEVRASEEPKEVAVSALAASSPGLLSPRLAALREHALRELSPQVIERFPHSKAVEGSVLERAKDKLQDLRAALSRHIDTAPAQSIAPPVSETTPCSERALTLDRYAQLVEPLFSTPAKLPHSGWTGHIPFLFVLFGLLRPKTYVELGVLNGASLIAAASAATLENLDTRLYGIDTWQGDEHAGYYEGDVLYAELRDYLASEFPNATLIRSLFSAARAQFAPGSIDLLHIDGLHTYEAVKEDFDTWLPALSPNGVILFHDIAVFDRNFGVHRLWDELKARYATFEFRHAYGLGVLLLNPELPALAPLRELREDPQKADGYRSLVINVAGTLVERMKLKERASLAETEIAGLLASSSWRITAPLRMLRRRLGAA